MDFSFENICRSCGFKRHNLLNLFKKDQDEDEDTTLGEKLILLASSICEINEGDELPQNICYSCARKLESAINFLNKIKLNNDKLWKIVNSNENQDKNISNNFLDDNIESYNEEHISEYNIHVGNDDTNIYMLEDGVRDSDEKFELIELNSDGNCSPIQMKNNLTESAVNTNEKGITCKECNKDFFTEKALNLHTKLKHKSLSINNRIFKCEICEQQLNSKKALNLHIKFKHKFQQVKDISIGIEIEHVNNFKEMDCCEILETEPKKQSNINLDLKRHIEQPKNEYLDDNTEITQSVFYECPTVGCEKRFPNKYKVSAHLRRHHNIPFSSSETKLLMPMSNDTRKVPKL